MSEKERIACGQQTICKNSKLVNLKYDKYSKIYCEGVIEFDKRTNCYQGIYSLFNGKGIYFDCAPAMSLTSQERIRELLEASLAVPSETKDISERLKDFNEKFVKK